MSIDIQLAERNYKHKTERNLGNRLKTAREMGIAK